MSTYPVFKIHSKSSDEDKTTYRKLRPYRDPAVSPGDSTEPLERWIVFECHHQEAYNQGVGIDIDFVMEEFYRCHPDKSQHRGLIHDLDLNAARKHMSSPPA